MKTSHALTLALLTAALPTRSGAEDTTARTSAYQSSVAQDQLRGQTKKVRQELIALLEEFQSNQAAAAEIAQTKQALERLDSLSDKDMADVVQALRDASRATDPAQANGKLAVAGASQKNIQSALRLLADKLSTQKDEATMRQRLRILAVRQTSAQRQGQILAARWFDPPVIALAVAEQEALKNEVNSALETLTRLATIPGPSGQVFAGALAVGRNARVGEQVAAAATETAAKNFAGAVASQGAVIEGLQAMIERLNSTRTAEERTREMATKMKELASNQKQLADSTQKSYVAGEAYITKEQAKLSSELSVLQDEISKLNPTAGTQAEQAEKGMRDLDDKLEKNPVLIDKIEGKNDVVQSQNNAAQNLGAVSDLLQKQANDLAKAQNPANQNADPMTSDPQFSAIQNAAKEVMEAKSKMDLADKNMIFKGDAATANAEMEAAKEALAAALADAAAAGDAVDKDVGENLQGAQKDLAGAKGQAGSDQQKAHDGIGEAQKGAAKALAGLQKAANALMAARGGMQPGHGGMFGKGSGHGAPIAGMGMGNPDGAGAILTDVSATSGISPQDRAALSLLQREKAPLEYNEMVRQYLKNLADGEMPGE